MAATSMRKRGLDSIGDPSVVDPPIKRPRYCCIRLASESSADASDGTESVDSIQGKETDYVKDTSDTESNTTEYEVEIEYEVDSSLSGSDKDLSDVSSDSEADMMLAAAAAAACDSNFEPFITDAEDSDDSSFQDSASSGRADFRTCSQCKSKNDNPQFPVCDRCFKDRKTLFPPRPRGHKKSKRKLDKASRTSGPVKLTTLKSLMNRLPSHRQDSGGSSLSQDSGLGLSQESLESSQEDQVPPLQLDEIVIPKHLTKDSSEKSSVSERQKPSSSRENGKVINKEETTGKKTTAEDDQPGMGALPELKENCIMCSNNPKNSVFLHGRYGHMCCCYACAIKTWKTIKRCPICRKKVTNVVRVFTS